MTEIYTKEEKHVFRLLSMLNKEGRFVLKLYMRHVLPGFSCKTFEEYLGQDHVKERIKEGLEKSKVLTMEQYIKLYPHSGAPDLDALDISLLVFLIRQLHPFMKVSNKIWLDPLDTDTGIEADVTRLKEIRNMLVHLGDASLTTIEFEREYERLKTILCRLIKTVGTNTDTPEDMTRRLELKKKGTLDASPVKRDTCTNVSNSLERISKTEQTVSVYDKTTSTSSLQKSKSGEVEQTCRGRKCFNLSSVLICRPCCKRIRTRTMMTNDHSSLEYRCSITSITVLRNGTLLVTDRVHNVVEAFTKTGQPFQEFRCQAPNSICAINHDSVIVSLCKERKLLVLAVESHSMKLTLKSEYSLKCSCDIVGIKYNEGFVYVLCETGEVRAIKSNNGAEQALYQTGVQSPSYFDISPDGEYIYITKRTSITRLRLHLPGDECRVFSDREGRALKGISVSHRGVFVSVWDEDLVLKLDKDLRYVSEKVLDDLLSPMGIHKRHGRLYLSKFKTDLIEQACREIVIAKL